MLPKKNKLTSEEVRSLLSRSQKIKTPDFSIFWRNTDLTTKAAVIVPNRLAATAVQKNRLKRKVYESLRLWLGENKPKKEIIVIVNNINTARIKGMDLRDKITHTLRLLNR